MIKFPSRVLLPGWKCNALTKRRLTFSGQNDLIPHKTEHFITRAVIPSNAGCFKKSFTTLEAYVWSWSYLRLTVSQSVSMSWCRAPLWGPWPDFIFYFLLLENCFLFVLGHPLWREGGYVICSAMCQWSESRWTHNHTLLSHLRLLGSLSVASYDLQGLRWKYSYPPPHEEGLYKFIPKICAVFWNVTM
jgi:hypothetical protein